MIYEVSAERQRGEAWSPDSWKTRVHPQEVRYDDPLSLEAALTTLRALPPLVTSWEIERLKQQLAEAQEGRRFLLQGGDCAETFADCKPWIITNKLKILLQMSLVLVHGSMTPVIRVGRFAGQYAKPRSRATEVRNGVSLPSYFGDAVNRSEFTAEARRPDPALMVSAYQHSAMTLNFIRSLSAGGFADMHHPEYWDLNFFKRGAVADTVRHEYKTAARKLADAMRFMEALGERPIDSMTRVDFYTSHEGLHLHYEAAQTSKVPRRDGHYDLSTHFPWIGERTRDEDGAHIEFFRGVANPIGLKVGPNADPEAIVRVIERLNPHDEPGKITIITRMGATGVLERLPPLVRLVQQAGKRVLWVTDPMHANMRTTGSGVKTRRFDDIIAELDRTFEVHEALGTHVGGVHFELTGEDVTECVGGSSGITEEDLDQNYRTACDPRLNYGQAMEMSFLIARKMANDPRGHGGMSSRPPPKP
ncbi:MAG: 3-deoxy-7-phosphoheptulonate synthase class II [Polyangiales bacterium]